MEKVIVGMSGGVDSAAAAWLLREAGYDVTGVTLRTWSSGESSRCCEIDDARAAARRIGIPFHALNCVDAFRDAVLTPFADSCRRGLTPNPCVVCNRSVKWARLLHTAALLGADRVATGHYASVERLADGRWTVRRGADAGKDQSYMLCRLTQDQLSRTLLPLGDRTKAEVRALARRAGLPTADKPDSQELCFLSAGGRGEHLARVLGPEVPGTGPFTDPAGNVLGTHRGVYRYTVGQRRGLGLALGRPVYVSRIDAAANRVVVGEEEDLYRETVLCRRLHFQALADLPPAAPTPALVQIRYRHPGAAATLERVGRDLLRVVFRRPVRAPAPGQEAVFYDGAGRVLGCGEICPEKD